MSQPLMASQSLNALIILTISSYLVISVSTQSQSEGTAESDTLYDTELCKGEWKFPQQCNTLNCDYKASWEYIDNNDEIMFTISTKNRNKWTGIGFSENQAMPETDAILGLVEESGRFFLMDSWLRAYEAPPLDQSQNLYNMSAWRENGITTLRFFRKRITGDNKDFQFTDTNCPYLIFPVMGGVFNAVNKRIRKHETTPIISDRKVCIRSCRTPPPPPPTTTPANTAVKVDTEPSMKASDDNEVSNNKDSSVSSMAPTSPSTQAPNESKTKDKPNTSDISYRIALKLPGIWKQNLKDNNSENYKTLLSNIKQQMHNELIKQYPTFTKLDVLEVTGQDTQHNDAIASIDLDVQPNDSQSTETYSQLSTILSAIISDEMLGDMRVDPKYLIIDRKEESNSLGKEFGFLWNEEKMKWIIIFVGIAALIGLVLIQAICMLCRSNNNNDENISKNKAKPDKSAPNSQWKDYADVSARSGYSYDNYGVSDETDAPLNANGQSLGRNEKMNGNKQFYKNVTEKMPQKYISATLERQSSRPHRTNEFTSAYATHDRKDAYNRHSFIEPSFSPQLQPDFYFMPHQRRYSGEVVSVYVDYNNPQFNPK